MTCYYIILDKIKTYIVRHNHLKHFIPYAYGHPIRVWDIPYAYGQNMRMGQNTAAAAAAKEGCGFPKWFTLSENSL